MLLDGFDAALKKKFQIVLTATAIKRELLKF